MPDEASPAGLSLDQLAERLKGPPPVVFATLLALAGQGVREAQALVGQMLLDGHGVARDPKDAFAWFMKAALAGDPMGCNMVGRCYENGWGVVVDEVRATDWFRRAAEAGLDWGMYNYATSLVLGRGVTMDRRAAFAWFAKAAGLGHAKSMNVLGGFHEDGWETPPDLAEARRLYQAAAAGGDFRGMFNLARLTLAEGRPQDALPWIRAAAEAGTPAFVQKMADYLAARDPDLAAEVERLRG